MGLGGRPVSGRRWLPAQTVSVYSVQWLPGASRHSKPAGFADAALGTEDYGTEAAVGDYGTGVEPGDYGTEVAAALPTGSAVRTQDFAVEFCNVNNSVPELTLL